MGFRLGFLALSCKTGELEVDISSCCLQGCLHPPNSGGSGGLHPLTFCRKRRTPRLLHPLTFCEESHFCIFEDVRTVLICSSSSILNGFRTFTEAQFYFFAAARPKQHNSNALLDSMILRKKSPKVGGFGPPDFLPKTLHPPPDFCTP